MSKFWYFLTTFAESGLSVFGIRSHYEQPAYQVVQQLTPTVEIRRYAPRTAVETPIAYANDGEAFGRLFRYITGANTGHQTIPMTAPVAEQPAMIAMTVPVETNADTMTMRFFLPSAVVQAGTPKPTDPKVHVVTLPAVTWGVIRYSGVATQQARESEAAQLRSTLAKAGKAAQGAPIYLSYDPPFTVPFLRRNEVALVIEDGS
jgi:hypothetical protein